jgi:hypothetical protein
METFGYIINLENELIETFQDEILKGYIDENEFEMQITTERHLTYYKEQIKAIQELRLYDFSEMNDPKNTFEIAFQGIYNELNYSGRVFDKSNYKFTLADLVD